MKKIIQLAGIRILIAPAFLFIFFLLNSCSNMNNPSYNNMTVTQGANDVYIQGMAFSPASLTITAGTTVTWTNKDAIAHTVTTDSTLFNSGNIMTNGVYSHTFNNVGIFTYHCSIHPTMKAKITVNAYVAPPSGY